MENAVDALKTAFAVLVFVIAIALTFSIISNIRQSSDILFQMSDRNKYYIDDLEGYTYISGTNKINRSVGEETIIPTIYRYYKENFGVTIMGKNTAGSLEMKARFDLDTENIINNWKTNSDTTNQNHIDYLNTYINPNKLTIGGSNNNILNNVYEINDNIYNSAPTNLYIINYHDIPKRKIAAPWIGSEERILERIKIDIYGGEADYDSYTKYEGKNIIDDINGHTFTEYFVLVPGEDINKTDKLEIIYVEE